MQQESVAHFEAADWVVSQMLAAVVAALRVECVLALSVLVPLVLLLVLPVLGLLDDDDRCFDAENSILLAQKSRESAALEILSLRLRIDDDELLLQLYDRLQDRR